MQLQFCSECAEQNVLNEKLLRAIQDKNPVHVFACLVDGAQANGKDKNGHAFLVHADSADGYGASIPPEVRKTNPRNVYGILTNYSVNSKPPSTIEVAGTRFNVHDPSPSHGPDDLGVLQYLIDGDRQFIENNFGKIVSDFEPDWINRDPTWFRILLDFYHLGECNMRWKQEIADDLHGLRRLLKEANFYSIPKMMTNTAKRIKNLEATAFASQFMSFLKSILENSPNAVFLTLIGHMGYWVEDTYGYIHGYVWYMQMSTDDADDMAEDHDEHGLVPPSMAERVARAISTAAVKEETWELRLTLGPTTERQAGTIWESLQRGFTEIYNGYASFTSSEAQDFKIVIRSAYIPRDPQRPN